jgi:hypothetical protein
VACGGAERTEGVLWKGLLTGFNRAALFFFGHIRSSEDNMLEDHIGTVASAPTQMINYLFVGFPPLQVPPTVDFLRAVEDRAVETLYGSHLTRIYYQHRFVPN